MNCERHAAGPLRLDRMRQTQAVCPFSWLPQYSVDDSGQPAGFAIDVMDEITIRAGLTDSYVIVDNFSIAEMSSRAMP